jgi:hypothetical protein
MLKEHDAGATFVELGRRRGVHLNTVSAWKVEATSARFTEKANSPSPTSPQCATVSVPRQPTSCPTASGGSERG